MTAGNLSDSLWLWQSWAKERAQRHSQLSLAPRFRLPQATPVTRLNGIPLSQETSTLTGSHWIAYGGLSCLGVMHGTVIHCSICMASMSTNYCKAEYQKLADWPIRTRFIARPAQARVDDQTNTQIFTRKSLSVAPVIMGGVGEVGLDLAWSGLGVCLYVHELNVREHVLCGHVGTVCTYVNM